MSQTSTDRALRVHEVLLAYYGEPNPKPQRDPLSELVLTILSQNTADVNTSRAFASLKARFPTWEAVLEATPEEVAAAIHIGGLSRIKAPRIQRILRQLREERGQLDLSFLATMPTDQARAYLTSLHGVGQKTAACVLLFSLHKPAMPVDTHIHRVTRRLGLVPHNASADRANEILESLLPESAYYAFHLNVIRHGRTLCKPTHPRCDECPLASLCDYAHTKASSAPTAPSQAKTHG